jgi:hypothetical protein
MLLFTTYTNTHTRMAEQALKYRLAASAQAMIEALRPRPLLREEMTLEVMTAIADHTHQPGPDRETPILHLPAAAVWMELEEPMTTNAGEIAGIFFCSADHEIERMLEEEKRPTMREVLKASGRQGREPKWILHFIDRSGTPTSHYEYYEESKQWHIIPGREPCPTEECREQEHGDGTFYIMPCTFCGTILALWRSWFVTALFAVEGEYAATETAEWPRHREQTTRKVKRPTSAKYDEIQVSHDYYLVSFDASVKRVRPTSQPEQATEREVTPRGSWVEAAQEIDPESVVYVRHDFGKTQRQLDPTRNPRWKERKTVEVKAYRKRVPMKVNSLQRRITRVIASKYQPQEVKE